jgi:hypothetical protein
MEIGKSSSILTKLAYYDYRYQPRPDGYFKNQKPATPGDLVEYDFDSSQQLLVPGDWNSQDDKLLFYEGTIWYKKSFNYQKKDTHVCLFTSEVRTTSATFI